MDAVLHDGPDAPIVRLRWVYTDAPFLPVGTGCVINNRVWNEDFYSDLPVGQLQPVVSNYVQDARWKLPAGLPNEHVCHGEWLPTGEPWPTNLPPTEYTCNGWPVCCGVIDDCPRGGVAVGGSAGDVYHPGDPTSGGVSVGGTAGDHFDALEPTHGGIAIGGEAGDVPSWVDGTEGGIEIGGEAGDSYELFSGEYERHVAGPYTFVPEWTGPHLIKMTGGGGGGMDGAIDSGGGGGGGGAESNSVIVLTAGVTYDIDVGKGGSQANGDGGFTRLRLGPVTLQLATGGLTATGILGVAGGSAAGCIGDQTWSGGNGADGTVGDEIPPAAGGGGGSSASYEPTGTPAGTGGDAIGQVGGTPPGDGGAGGNGGSIGVNGDDGGFWSGGGGGGGGGALAGVGYDGRIDIIWPAG